MEFRILGPLEVFDEGRSVDIGAAKQRALLAVLLLDANRVVPTDVLIEALWGERPPATATKALQVHVSQLRKALGRDRISPARQATNCVSTPMSSTPNASSASSQPNGTKTRSSCGVARRSPTSRTRLSRSPTSRGWRSAERLRRAANRVGSRLGKARSSDRRARAARARAPHA